jgi:predicted MPP superfamily phosphohydrolase
MGFVATVILIIFFGALAWWWKTHRLLRSARRSAWWHAAAAVFFIAQLGGLLLIILSRSVEGPWETLASRPLLSAVYIWHLLILPLLLIGWLVVAVVKLIASFARKLRRSHLGEKAAEAADAVSRRDFLATTIAAAPALVALGATAIALPQLQEFRVRRFTVRLRQLPAALDGLTIAHVSDLHVGRFTKGRVLEAITHATNDLRSDLVLLTGDLINHALSDLPAALDVVKALRGTHGVFMCEGNHDLIENGREFRRRTVASGVPLLVNESTVIDVRGTPLQLLGLRWGSPRQQGPRSSERGDVAISASLQQLLQLRRTDAFQVLLAHHPHAFDFAEGVPLTLAGHTHGGQLMLSDEAGFGPMMYRYWSGLYEREARALSVSNGVGNWFPLRVRAPAEIIHLTLRRT